jgi:glycosyltransferase involved in cell wall biosynthesis
MKLKKLLVIGFVWPEPNSSAAGSRMMQLIHFFKSQNFTITFASPCAKSDRAFDLTTIGIEQVPIKLNDESFDTFIKKLGPDIVLFDRFMMEEQFGWRVTEQCPNALRILDTEDLHCLRKGRQQAFKEQRPFDNTYLFNETAKREIASIYRCDLSLIISEAEMEILKEQFKMDERLLCHLPFMLDPISKETIQKLPKFEERAHFVTIGNFLHEPNYDAVKYLKGTVWPIIRQQLPKAELHIYGAYPSQKVEQMQNKKEGFYIKGFAEDANLVMQNARVCLSPLRFGAGLKGKLIDAMQNGAPCAMSTIAAEGMFGPETSGLEPNGFIEDNPQVFAQKAVELYTNENIWKTYQINGFEIINKRFNKTNFEIKLKETIGNLSNNLEKMRLQNFIGAMLYHHSMQSTKFMSRWIEEKNKKTN